MSDRSPWLRDVSAVYAGDRAPRRSVSGDRPELGDSSVGGGGPRVDGTGVLVTQSRADRADVGRRVGRDVRGAHGDESAAVGAKIGGRGRLLAKPVRRVHLAADRILGGRGGASRRIGRVSGAKSRCCWRWGSCAPRLHIRCSSPACGRSARTSPAWWRRWSRSMALPSRSRFWAKPRRPARWPAAC